MQRRVFMEKFKNWFWLILRLFRIPGDMGNLQKFWLENQMVRIIPFGKLHDQKTWVVISGAPNENIVQNHLNIALLNVF